MKKFLLPIMCCAVAVCAAADDKTADADSTGFTFTDTKVIKTTPVRDQNQSGTCWCFSTNTFFEDEILRKGGKEVDLSEMYIVRQCYLDKARKYVRMDGNVNFAQGGAAHDVPYVWDRYGMMPEEAYPGLNYGEEKHVHGELDAVLKAYLEPQAFHCLGERFQRNPRRLFRRTSRDIHLRRQDLYPQDICRVASHRHRRIHRSGIIHPSSFL